MKIGLLLGFGILNFLPFAADMSVPRQLAAQIYNPYGGWAGTGWPFIEYRWNRDRNAGGCWVEMRDARLRKTTDIIFSATFMNESGQEQTEQSHIYIAEGKSSGATYFAVCKSVNSSGISVKNVERN